MIPVEYFWFALIFAFGLIGSGRKMARELGVSTVLLISLFTLWEGWTLFVSKLVSTGQGQATGSQGSSIEVAYYAVVIVFVAFICYEGVSLSFPLGVSGGFWKAVVGFLAGLANGYLIVGTVWNVVARAGYFESKVKLLSCCLTDLHNTVVQWLPVTLMDRTSPLLFLVPGVFLLLLMVLK